MNSPWGINQNFDGCPLGCAAPGAEDGVFLPTLHFDCYVRTSRLPHSFSSSQRPSSQARSNCDKSRHMYVAVGSPRLPVQIGRASSSTVQRNVLLRDFEDFGFEPILTPTQAIRAPFGA